FGRETKDTIRRETWSFSIRAAVAPPTVLATRHKSRAPCSTAAASKLLGTPELRPKPEIEIDAPFGMSATASAGEAQSLFIVPRSRVMDDTKSPGRAVPPCSKNWGVRA